MTGLSTFDDSAPQNGSKTIPKSPNRPLGYPHEGPFVDPCTHTCSRWLLVSHTTTPPPTSPPTSPPPPPPRASRPIRPETGVSVPRRASPSRSGPVRPGAGRGVRGSHARPAGHRNCPHVFTINTRVQRKLLRACIISVIVKHQLVQIGRIERPSVYS